ncbi:methyl-accepting chemotaxis protein [Massilia sp. TS11]|uniref:methyl-accepting chemotaxis protein n=1 Tax=Massilia sp. TS11 TaxID=2908003 RepID=UPI0022AAE9DB|nr:methyl-accepting chemotaxis protein [Massilia sp. TS11]
MSFKDLKIGHKLALGFGAVILAAVGLGLVALYEVGDLAKAFEKVTADRYPKTVQAQRIKDKLNETARNTRNMLIMDDEAAIASEMQNIAEAGKVITATLEELDRTVKSEQGRAKLAAIGTARADFLKTRTQFLDAVKDKRFDQARTILLKDMRPLQLRYMEAIDQFLEFQTIQMKDATVSAEATVQTTRVLVIGLLVVAVAVGVAVVILMMRSIVTPLTEAVSVARRVAEGDLTAHIEVDRKDETGEMLGALEAMNSSLQRIVREVRTGTDSIATAAEQIASGNMDLSGRTEQQASSLEETASSMEEMTSTVRQNADNSRQARQLANSASQIAEQGGSVVQQVVETMGGINNASRKIVDIIAVIDGIAFQTNILALNAAVEAARAGEQGRGFAVVASEVRNLAQRSAAAAKEIKVLISDSVGQVDRGAALVNEAGATMQNVLESVRRVTDVMSEIAAASVEQEAGIEQINQAVTEMDTVTQQNAALVEEAAAAAAALRDQAERLSATVAVFKLDHQPAAPAPAPAPQRPQLAVVKAAPAPVKRSPAPAATADADWAEF